MLCSCLFDIISFYLKIFKNKTISSIFDQGSDILATEALSYISFCLPNLILFFLMLCTCLFDIISCYLRIFKQSHGSSIRDPISRQTSDPLNHRDYMRLLYFVLSTKIKKFQLLKLDKNFLPEFL